MLKIVFFSCVNCTLQLLFQTKNNILNYGLHGRSIVVVCQVILTNDTGSDIDRTCNCYCLVHVFDRTFNIFVMIDNLSPWHMNVRLPYRLSTELNKKNIFSYIF